MDFTLKTYSKLLNTLINQGFLFSTFGEYISNSSEKVIVLRHDVDLLPANSVQFARIQAAKGIKGTYYFRNVPDSFDERIIKEIYSLGHEIGYHYEDLVFAMQNAKCKMQKKGNLEEYEKYLAEIAIEIFNYNLMRLRQIVPVKTICMHGSPMSRWDSRLLWKYYDYYDFGIAGEPYFDVDFGKVLYLTDTGRRWDGNAYNIRDKATGYRLRVSGIKEGAKERMGNGETSLRYSNWKVKPVPGSLMNMTLESFDFQDKYKFRSTTEIIKAAEKGEMPGKMMMTFHPQRWMDKPGLWCRELVLQNIRNLGKYFLIKIGQKYNYLNF